MRQATRGLAKQVDKRVALRGGTGMRWRTKRLFDVYVLTPHMINSVGPLLAHSGVQPPELPPVSRQRVVSCQPVGGQCSERADKSGTCLARQDSLHLQRSWWCMRTSKPCHDRRRMGAASSTVFRSQVVARPVYDSHHSNMAWLA